MATNITAKQALEAYISDVPEFTDRFGDDITTNFDTWANAVLNIPEVRNSFCSYLINKIGRTYVNAMIAYNPLAFLRGEDLPYGSTIEDMFVNISKAYQFDPEGKNALKRKLPDVKVLYYYVNSNLTYKTTISQKELKLAFYREGQMGALIDRIVGSLYESAKHDMFIMLKRLIGNYDGWAYVKVPSFDGTEATAKSVGSTIEEAILTARFDNHTLNAAGVINNVPEGEGLLIMNIKTKISLDFDYLANVFNLSKAELQARTVIVDDFGGLQNGVAIYCDKRLFQNHFLYENTDVERNVDGQFTNYYRFEEAIYSMSKYMTGIAFVTSDLLTITIDPNTGGGTAYTRQTPSGVNFSLPFNNFEAPAGKAFKGWATSATATTGLLPELSNVKPTAATTYYAIWG